MAKDPFRRFRCWTAGEVQSTIFGDIASLGLEADAVFLAAHTSLELEHLKGVQHPGADREVAVLRALDSSFGLPHENTLIAVTGPSGSGKSHLVRWVRAQLSEKAEPYHLIYVPKALETLRQLLGHILDRMPSPESDAVKAELDKAVGQKRPEQFSEELLDGLRSVLGYELPGAKEGQDEETRTYLLGTAGEGDSTRREGGLSDLLLVKPIRDHLLRDGGAIARMVDSVRGQRRGDEETPEFDSTDFPVKQAGVRSQLQGRLLHLWDFVRSDPTMAATLLNEARNRAVAEALGMRVGVNLGEVFAKTRRRLRAEGKELVLLFEDLAQFGLFDGDLYDQFATQPGEDLAPIRALFAITDGKFAENVPPTVQTRLAHRFHVGELVNALGEMDDGTPAFASRYLNIARVGRDRLIKALAAATPAERESGQWIPNACFDRLGDGRECVNREECWSSFGQIGEVGLYPYNKIAFRRELENRGERVTARTIVDETIKALLIEADAAIGSGVFPPESSRDRFNFSVGLAKESIVPVGALDEGERDRLHRCRVIWADGAVEPNGVTVAFDLPTVGGPGPQPVAEPKKSKLLEQRESKPLVTVFAWQNGEALPESDAVWYRERLRDLVAARVDLAGMLIDPGPGLGQVLLSKVLAPNSFELTNAPGQPAGKNRLRFPVEPDDAGVRLLSAVRWWWEHGHWNIEDPGRGWDFPLDPSTAQVDLDEFLDHATAAAEGALVAILMRGPLDPASAAVALRATANRALGQDTDVDRHRSLEWVLASPSARSVSASPVWEAVALESLGTLNDIGPGWITTFASARQGETGDPLCVDAARLLPVARAASEDPLHLLTVPVAFDDSFSEITQHWEDLLRELNDSIDAESRTLTETIERIETRVAEAEFEDLIGVVASAGQLAGDHNVFRPQAQYRAFKDACDRLRQTSNSAIAELLSAAAGLTQAERTATVRAVLDAQRWASRARSVDEDLAVVHGCLETTAAELTDRLVDELGVTPEAAAGELSDKVKEVIAELDAVFNNGGSP